MTIQVLKQKGESNRAIARRLGVVDPLGALAEVAGFEVADPLGALAGLESVFR